MATLFGIDSAYPITPQQARDAKADVVAVYVGGVNNGGWRWQPQHAQALRDAGFRLFPIYVGQNWGYASDRLNYAGGVDEAHDAIACAKRFGFNGGILCADLEYGNWENAPTSTANYANGFCETLHANDWIPFPYITVRMAREWNPTVPVAMWVVEWFPNEPNYLPDIVDTPIPMGKAIGVGWQYWDRHLGTYDASVFDDYLFTGGHVKPYDWTEGQFMTDLPGKVVQDGAVEVRYFPVTGHTIRYGFRAFWEKFGNLVLFGYPISEEFVQPDGVTVQYFERARFEWSSTYTDHPERFNVRLGLVGKEAVAASSVASTLPTLNNPFYRREL